MPADSHTVNVPRFMAMKSQNRKITMLTAYDFPTAQMIDEAGVDSILVGDTLAVVMQGHATTISATLDQLIYHGEMVCRAVKRALVIVDMPFLSYQISLQKAIENAGRILKETGCQAVKLEGGEEQAGTIAGLVNAGIPVMAHVGLRPQSVNQSGYRVQRDEEKLLKDARAAEQAGAFGVVIECVPEDLAAKLTKTLSIPTIGIGAGTHCDGQVLVTYDMLGLTVGPIPRFVKRYAHLNQNISNAISQFCKEVRTGDFPNDEHAYK